MTITRTKHLLVATCICWKDLRIMGSDTKDLSRLMKERGWRYDKTDKQVYCPDHEKA